MSSNQELFCCNRQSRKLQPAITKATTGDRFFFNGDGVATPTSFFCWNQHNVLLLPAYIFVTTSKPEGEYFFHEFVIGVLRPATGRSYGRPSCHCRRGSFNRGRRLLHAWIQRKRHEPTTTRGRLPAAGATSARTGALRPVVCSSMEVRVWRRIGEEEDTGKKT